MSVLFDSNASLIDVAPVTPMLLSVDFMRKEKNRLLIDAVCVLFLLCSPLRLSLVSVLFDFNASLNDVAPVTPMLHSTFYENEKAVYCRLMPFVCCIFYLHDSDRVELLLCSSSMHHSKMLLLFLQCGLLSI